MRVFLVSLAVALLGCGTTPIDASDAGADAGFPSQVAALPPFWFHCIDTMTCTTGESSDIDTSRDWCADDEAAAKQREIDTPPANCKNSQCSCAPHYCTTDQEPCKKSGPGPTYWFECRETAVCGSNPPRDFTGGGYCVASEAAAMQMESDHSDALCTVPGCICTPHYCTTKREPCTP